MAGRVFKSSDGALFVQTHGPNTRPRFVGCVDVDALTEPGGAIDTLIRCFKEDGTGWKILNSTVAPPDPVTTTLTTIVEGTANYLEQIRSGLATLFVHQRDGGRADTFGNYVRSWVLESVHVGEKSGTDLAMREEDNPSMQAFGISAFPPIYRVYQKTTGRQSVSVAEAVNAVHFCGVGLDLCQTGFAVTDALAGSPADKADVLYTTDGGDTWTAASTQPFAGAENIAAVTCFLIGRNTTRVVVARGTTDAGNPMEIAYSDNNGTTWTTVNTGTTNALFAQGPHSLFAYDPYNMWVVVDSGYVYYSDDAGITWSTQDAGVATSSDLNAIHFATDRVGYAVGAADAIIKTEDGGQSWTAATGNTGTGADILTVHVIDADNVWIGTDDGELWYTEDGGVTWTQRAFSGDGVGAVNAVRFAPGTALFGVMLHDNASPVGTAYITIDGGYTWEAVTTFTNTGLNQVFVCDHNLAYFAGEIQGGTGVIGKLFAKP